MTSEERARDIHRRTTMPDGGGGIGEQFVLDHIRAALAEEREACAAMLEAMAKRGESPEIRAAYSLSARAIRARP